MLDPRSSSAIRLQWSTGTTDLTFTSAVRCTLVVQADPAEGRLPSEWRLLWVADSCSIQPLALGPTAACQGDIAQVSGVDPPTTPADITENLVTAHFCSSGGGGASTAQYLLDLPTAARGKLRVVAIDPTDPDSLRVIQSSEATFNGGVVDAYPPAILRCSTSHASIQLSVRAIGSGLAGANSAAVAAPDSTWSVPLQIVEQGDSAVAAVAEVPAALPSSVLQVSLSSGAKATTAIPADQVSGPDPATVILPDFFDPNPKVYPKDFAFIYNTVPNPWHGLFHLFYIRHSTTLPDTANERFFGHAWWSDTTRGWQVDSAAFAVGATGWDAAHIWAPTIIYLGGLYYMLYTGVDSNGDQRIGYATTALIDTTDTDATWARQNTWAFSANNTAWANQQSPQQFRDSFIMPDPDSTGRVLLFYTARNRFDGVDNAVGVARNVAGTLARWIDLGYYRSTDSGHSGGVAQVESPHIFPDSTHAAPDSASRATWRLFFTDGPAGPTRSIRFETKAIGASVPDTTLGNWSTPADSLYGYLHSDPTVYGWEATECLQASNVYFLAAYDGAGIRIRRMYWNGRDFVLGQASLVAVGNALEAESGRARLVVLEFRPGNATVGFRIELPGPMRAQLTVHDVMGRRMRTLVDRNLAAGTTSVWWDGRDAAGSAVPSGMYFTLLRSRGGNCVARVPIIR